MPGLGCCCLLPQGLGWRLLTHTGSWPRSHTTLPLGILHVLNQGDAGVSHFPWGLTVLV